MIKKLAPTKQKIFKKRMYGFDIETANSNKEFVVASIYSDGFLKFLYSPEEVREEFLHPRYRNSVIFATNLSFDFFGVFFKTKNFKTLFRGSDLLYAKSYYYKKQFYPYYKYDYPNLKDKKKGNTLPSITFLDSMNYAKLSVKKMGEIIGMQKLSTPSFLGRHPINDHELQLLKEYNKRDSEITYHFMKFIIYSFEKLGATFKNTLASTSMSLFKNEFLTGNYFQPDEDKLLEQFESYYGGRTEAFKRGYIKDHFYYDFNSLYPSVMRDEEFPDPNSLRVVRKNDIRYIKEFEGCSKVDVYVFPTRYPILPHRNDDGRVIFATGNLTGWYTHVELRAAIDQGAVIKKVYKTHYFTKTCRPFKSFVSTLYDLRQKNRDTPFQYVIKICLNSLYGKFGQRFLNKDNWLHESVVTYEMLQKCDNPERKGEYFRIVRDSKPAAFCIPIWASYVTAYGRLKLHKAIEQHDPVYVDTDSILIDHEIEESNDLGKLKCEMKIKEGIIVRPKFYALVDREDKDHVKIKGLGKRLTFLEFLGLMYSPLVNYEKFAKFKEALRRDIIPNEIISVHKEFSLEDEKRLWRNRFNYLHLEDSEPIDIDSYISEKDCLKIEQLMDQRIAARDRGLIDDDNFDKHSVGNDITYEEFLENERKAIFR